MEQHSYADSRSQSCLVCNGPSSNFIPSRRIVQRHLNFMFYGIKRVIYVGLAVFLELIMEILITRHKYTSLPLSLRDISCLTSNQLRHQRRKLTLEYSRRQLIDMLPGGGFELRDSVESLRLSPSPQISTWCMTRNFRYVSFILLDVWTC